eukprot:XP_013974128.1 splicing factor, proline- and glutamine-rich-like [Canis lupus familiaris]
MVTPVENMEKVIVPSVTLIVGCGVSSLTLLMLIIIYVSVWRWGPSAWAGARGGGPSGSQARGGWGQGSSLLCESAAAVGWCGAPFRVKSATPPTPWKSQLPQFPLPTPSPPPPLPSVLSPLPPASPPARSPPPDDTDVLVGGTLLLHPPPRAHGAATRPPTSQCTPG